ncbi:MAG: Hsp20/alpha crystallin family protein [Patescibacteria group bacterium]|jgi:HSP20 family protein
MAIDIVPSRFWSFPTRWFDLDEDETALSTTSPSGLSISEDDKNIYVEAAMPGVDPKEAEITFDKGVLWIKGESKQEEKEKKYYRKAARSFSYRVAVPGEIDSNKEPEAMMENGIMTVTFPKSPQSQPKKISVKSKSK